MTHAKPGIAYWLFEGYVRLFHDCVYYKKVHILQAENIPQEHPLMIVSNHQNSLNDGLAIVFAVNKSKRRRNRKLRAIARADAFAYPGMNKLFRGLGLMPAFRMAYDGMRNVSNNTHTFDEVSNELLNDGAVVIYPEAGHQDKRWLGRFSLGYTRMLFDAAQKSNFERDIYVLPACNHYSDYFNMRGDILHKFGEPISIAPYYELYQTKPRAAQKQLNEVVHERVSELMLNITDLKNYEAIDYLRETYGIEYARENGFDPDLLPEKLLADKQLVAQLDAWQENEGDSTLQPLLDRALELKNELERLRISDKDFDRTHSPLSLLGKGVMFALLSPLFLLAFLVNLLIIIPPRIMNSRINDVMFYGTMKIVISALITIPLTLLLMALLIWLFTKSWLLVVAGWLLLPFLGSFVCTYRNAILSWWKEIRFCRLLKKGKLKEVMEWRRIVFEGIRKGL